MTKDKLKQLVDAGIIDAIINDKPMQYRLEGGAWFDFEGMPDLDTDNVEYRVRPKLNQPRVVRYGDYTEDEREKIGTFIVVRSDGTCYEDYYRDWTINDSDTILVMRD
jgi:hypothetical protein